MIHLRTRRSRAAVFVSALLILGLLSAACGGDDDTDDAVEQNDQAAEQTDPATVEFCEANLAIDSAFSKGPDVDFETASGQEIEAAIEEFSAVLEPLIQEAEENAPEELADSVAVSASTARKVLKTGNDSLLGSDEFMQAQKEMDAWTLDNCDVERVDIAGLDFAFGGVPDTLPADTYIGFNFLNEGEEMHEMVLLRKNDDTTESTDELLQMPERKAMKKVTFEGVGFAPPGESDAAFLKLEAGDYMMVCFIPVGTTGKKDGDGPPHFAEGMVDDFTVE